MARTVLAALMGTLLGVFAAGPLLLSGAQTAQPTQSDANAAIDVLRAYVASHPDPTSTTVAPTTTSSPTTSTSTAPTTSSSVPSAAPNCAGTGNGAVGSTKGGLMGFANGYRYGQLSGADRTRYMDAFAASGAHWYRMNLENWSLAEAQDVVAKAKARGLCVVGNLNANPSGTHWADPPNHQAWVDNAVATFVRPLMADVNVWEVWNEPNLDGFWPGRNSDSYADLLHRTYLAIHAADPDAVVMGAGLAPQGNGTDPNNSVNFWTRVYNWNAAQGRKGSIEMFDALAHHPYLYPEDPTNTANDKDWSGWYQTKLIHDLMVSKGDTAKRVWGTEAGFPTGCALSQCITLTEAARRIPLQYDRWTGEWGAFTGPLMFHQLQDQPGESGVEPFFGFIRSDWSHKDPEYQVFADYAGRPR